MLRVLIIRPGALGDTLMVLPALNDLAGKAAVTFVGRRPGLDFIRSHVDRAMDLEASGWHRLFMEIPDGKGLPVSDVNIAAAFFRDKDGTIRRNLERCLPSAAVHVFPSFPPKGEDVHVAEYLARCLASAGLPVDPVRSIAAMKHGGMWRNRPLPEGEKKIILHPGSGSLEKNYPPDFWLALVTRLLSDTEFRRCRPVLLTGPAEESLYAYFKERLGTGSVLFVSSPDQENLISLLDSAVLFLGHDSGIAHLSAMRCIPTGALFKASDPLQWAPLGPFVRIIKTRDPGPEMLDATLQAARELVAMDRS
ncbi:MAG: glycosyltransferase family 9 protein [Deltaproteobacteria bacterium]|nr:glycosyltransferase family 9 protein [Deltaproteobacteria bacterium]